MRSRSPLWLSISSPDYYERNVELPYRTKGLTSTRTSMLERELTHTDTTLAHAIHESPVWRETDDLLCSVR